VVPGLRNRMGEDFTQLLQTALGLRSSGQGPLLLAHSIKQCGLRMQACIVGLSLRIGDSVWVRSVGSSAGPGFAAKAQRGDGRRGDGRGDSSVLVCRTLSLLIALGKSNGFLDNLVREH
jgi:hypothetical protein